MSRRDSAEVQREEKREGPPLPAPTSQSSDTFLLNPCERDSNPVQREVGGKGDSPDSQVWGAAREGGDSGGGGLISRGPGLREAVRGTKEGG